MSTTTITVSATMYIVTSHNCRIEALENGIFNVEKDVKVLNTQMRVLLEMSCGLTRALTGEQEGPKKCREAGSDC